MKIAQSASLKTIISLAQASTPTHWHIAHNPFSHVSPVSEYKCNPQQTKIKEIVSQMTLELFIQSFTILNICLIQV